MEIDPEEANLQRYRKAVDEKKFSLALSTMSTGLVLQMLRMLQGEGYSVGFPEKPSHSLEFFGGIAASLDARIAEEGDVASYKLTVAREVAASLYGLQALLLRPADPKVETGDELGQLIMQAMALGGIAEHLGLTLGGHFDEFGRLKFQEFSLKERQRDAARRTNEKRNRPKADALEEAKRICDKNPTLTNANLAERVRAKAAPRTTLKTLTDWMAQWRREGLLPERVKT